MGEPTLRDILDALSRPGRDPREDLPPPVFKKGILKLEDLQPGMELKGTVLNVVDFGAFVDIGLKDSGLVHISQMANRYIKSPYDVVAVTLDENFDSVPDPHEPEALLLAAPPEPVRRVSGRTESAVAVAAAPTAGALRRTPRPKGPMCRTSLA